MAPKCYFSEHFVANPATHSTKKREGHSAEMQKNTMLKKQRRTLCVFHMLAKLSMASFEALLSPEKKPSKIQRHPGVRSFFCVMSHKNDVRQNCVISFAFSYHIGGTCRYKTFRGHGTLHFLVPKNSAHPYWTTATWSLCTRCRSAPSTSVGFGGPFLCWTLDVFTIAQQDYPLADHDSLNHDPGHALACMLTDLTSWLVEVFMKVHMNLIGILSFEVPNCSPRPCARARVASAHQ